MSKRMLENHSTISYGMTQTKYCVKLNWTYLGDINEFPLNCLAFMVELTPYLIFEQLNIYIIQSQSEF